MRNVNYEENIRFLEKQLSFILTMRNVNLKVAALVVILIYGFILTMRNVNSIILTSSSTAS